MGERGEITENKLKIINGVFMDFLNENGHKRTSERMAILQEIYSLDNHFDVVELHHHLRSKNYKVSMATIYNNIKLYVEAGLITKHQFGKGTSQYERCYFRGDHDHIILTDTGVVMEFRDDRIDNIRETIEKTFGVKVERHSLYFYAKYCDEAKNLNSAGSMPFVESSGVS
ncbi:MAG: transcriptional repressor [Bacteroidota bacterium]